MNCKCAQMVGLKSACIRLLAVLGLCVCSEGRHILSDKSKISFSVEWSNVITWVVPDRPRDELMTYLETHCGIAVFGYDGAPVFPDKM